MTDRPDAVDYVIDASALAKLFLDEPESTAFREWYLAEVHRGATFAAPSLLGYEIAHLLAKNLKAPVGGKEGAEWLGARHDEVMEGITLDEDAARQTFLWALKLTGYDASYLAVAVAGRACLVSYDLALLNEAARHKVRTQAPKQ
ncbi:MAG: type II toxin-antitoxin system VapC family toxin [Candidatus Thermoplasmatota archaeon]